MHPLIAAAAAALAGFALWNFLRRLRRDRLLADTAPARLRSAAQGYVKVSGRATAASATALQAPLSGRPCVWWSYDIARDDSQENQVADWRSIESAASVELFMLSDEDGGRCLVGPVCAEITPTTSNVWYGSTPRPLSTPTAMAGIRTGAWRYTERLLEVGAQLLVTGDLRSHSEVGDVTHAAQEKLRAWKADQQQLLQRFDHNHDGHIDQAEWDEARGAALQEAQAQTLVSGIARVSVIAEPANGEPFLIAPLSSAQLVGRERHYAALYFALGIAALYVCAWALRH
jgi:hypothetical protein